MIDNNKSNTVNDKIDKIYIYLNDQINDSNKIIVFGHRIFMSFNSTIDSSILKSLQI